MEPGNTNQTTAFEITYLFLFTGFVSGFGKEQTAVKVSHSLIKLPTRKKKKKSQN